MLNVVYAPWEQMPKNLRLSEVQQPLNVVHEFFYIDSPEGYQRRLKDWRHFVLTDEYFNDASEGPGHLLFIYEHHLRFLEALYLLLLDFKEYDYKYKAVTPAQLETEKKTWPWYPNELNKDELGIPYLVIDKIFAKINLQQFRDLLKEWMHAALYKQCIDESMTPGEMVLVYDSLLNLYSAGWLIHQRNSDEIETGDDSIVTEQPVKNEKTEVPDKTVRSLMTLYTETIPAEKLGLQAVEELIVREVPAVRKIILLGKHLNPFNYYLLILIDDEEKTPEHEVANKIEDKCRQLVSVFAFVHKVASSVQEITNGNHFWNTALYHGVNLYTAPEFLLPSHSHVSKQEWLDRSKSDWTRWGTQGKEFLKGAQQYFNDSNLSLAVFMLHQAVESSLIGIIKVLSAYRLSSHNLMRMFRITLLYTDEIMAVMDLDKKDANRLFNILQSGYSDARYKNDFNVNEKDVKSLLLQIELLVGRIDFVYMKFRTQLYRL